MCVRISNKTNILESMNKSRKINLKRAQFKLSQILYSLNEIQLDFYNPHLYLILLKHIELTKYTMASSDIKLILDAE